MIQNQILSELERMVVAAELGAWGEVGEVEEHLSETFSVRMEQNFADEDKRQLLGYYDRLILLVKQERDNISSEMSTLQRGNKQDNAYLSAC